MTKHMELRDSTVERLQQYKGLGSWSDVIERLLDSVEGKETAKIDLKTIEKNIMIKNETETLKIGIEKLIAEIVSRRS